MTGIDDRAVVSHEGTKSISQEETFAVDLFESERLNTEVTRMAESVGSRLRASGRRGRTISLKVRFGDFRTVGRSTTMSSPTDSGAVIGREARQLLLLIDATPGIRLLGVAVTGIAKATEGEQLSFDDLETNDGDWRNAEGAMDRIRERFGDRSIGTASSLRDDGIAPKRRGGQQWGPSDESP